MSYASVLAGFSPTSDWTCGEASGHIVDSVAANNSTVETSITYGQTGPLTGSGDNTTAVQGTLGSSSFGIPNATALQLGDTFTIIWWFKRSATQSSVQVLLDLGATGGDGAAFYFTSGNELWMTDSSSGALIIKPTAAITDQNWHMAMWTKATTTSHLYIDGSASETLGSNHVLSASTDAMRWGSDTTGANAFIGTYGQLAFIKGTALTSGNASSLYTAGTTGGGAGAPVEVFLHGGMFKRFEQRAKLWMPKMPRLWTPQLVTA